MATLSLFPTVKLLRQGNSVHRLRLLGAVVAAVSLVAFLTVHGYTYYLAGMEQRPLSPLHVQLRSSGPIGLKLGILGLALFGVLFLYPLRKRWKWLGGIGSTRHWLDFHAVIGITAPIIIGFHSTFKFRGLAGLAFLVMLIVAMSGFVGRYLYAKIPRGITSVRLTMEELEAQTATLAQRLSDQDYFRAEDLAPLLDVPSPQQIRTMSLVHLIWSLLSKDLARPFQESRLRRRMLSRSELVASAGGLLVSRNQNVESILSSIRRQSRLRATMAFLDRTERVFHLWHVIHRPFSLTFVVLVMVHIGVALSLGYY